MGVPSPLYLGTTALNEAFLCLAKFDYHQNQKLVPRPQDVRFTLRRGIWLHACLQHHYEGVAFAEVIETLTEWAQSHGVKTEDIERARDETSSIMEAYICYYRKEEPWTPIAAEKSMDISFPEIGLTLAPTIDCLAVWHGEYWLVEYKSTAQIPGALWRAIDPQTALQWVAVEQKLGARIAGVIFDYLYTVPPSIPRVTKATKTEPPRFYANSGVTSSQAFTLAVDQLKGDWEVWKQQPLSSWDADTCQLFGDYVASSRTKLVNDSKFFVRQISKRPEQQLLGTLKDIRVKVEEVRLAQRLGHWPRSFHQKICPVFCDYSELCAQEYMSGQRSQVIREELFVHDTGEREGRIEIKPQHGFSLDVHTAWDAGVPDDYSTVY